MSKLIAYIPVFNNRHLKWLESHPRATLYLINTSTACALLPRLTRNMGALNDERNIRAIGAACKDLPIGVTWFNPSYVREGDQFVMPDEDVSRELERVHLIPKGASATFELIWARWDMTTVKRQSPVMDGVPTVSSKVHAERMRVARDVSVRSPDWWRQIGAAVVVNGAIAAVACNDHYPTEYVTDILGDPRMNFNAGEKGVYVSAHAEQTVIAQCARAGIQTEGGVLYTTVFPCEACARLIVLAGFKTVFFREGYSVLDAREVLEGAGVEIVRVTDDPVSA